MDYSKTSKMLVDEHVNILKLAEIIERECQQLMKGKKIDDSFFVDAIYFIRNYADKFHHAKEEDILFKELCTAQVEGKMHCNPVEQMLHEHEQGRALIKGIEEGMKEKDRRKVITNALDYVNLIREHIAKEDDILYPMADEALDKKTEDKMIEEFKLAEKEREEQKKKSLEILEKLDRNTNIL